MLKSPKVATPFTGATVLVPDRVPGMSVPPLCPMAIVTESPKLATALPNASSAVTCTAGAIATRGSVVRGCTVKTRCSGGLSASAPASHECGDVKYQVQRASAEPPLGSTWYSPSALIKVSETSSILVKPGGGSVPTTPSDSVTPYATAPTPTGMVPASATVVVVSLPVAAWWAPSAHARTGFTPR